MLGGKDVYEIKNTGLSGYGQGGFGSIGKPRSRLALPVDLSESMEVCYIQDINLLNFQTNVLTLVENDPKVLIITYTEFNLLKSKLPQDDFIVHTISNANEEEAHEWISGKSDKKFLIADDPTVAGCEFDTVIIVFRKHRRDLISSLCQRATARLIVCIYSQYDLNESVQDVRLIEEDGNLSNFQSSVLNLVEDEHKVLIILAYTNNPDLVKSKLPPENFIVSTKNEANEKEACEWVMERSDKKFLIVDKDTVTVNEFDTVVIVAPDSKSDLLYVSGYKDHRSRTLCEIAKSRLIVCLYKDDNGEEIFSDSENEIEDYNDYFSCTGCKESKKRRKSLTNFSLRS